MDHVSERDAEEPWHFLDALFGGHKPRSAERELLVAKAHTAGAGRLDVLEPVGLTPKIQSYDHRVLSTKGAHWCVAQNTRLAPYVLQVGECGMTGEAQGHPVDDTARVSRERSWESH